MAENYENDPNSPGYHRKEHHEQESLAEIVQDVCKGTPHMRDCGVKYLPKHAAEKDDEYKIRKNRAVLFNATSRTLHTLVGLVFREEPKLGEDVPEWMRGNSGASSSEELGILRSLYNLATNSPGVSFASRAAAIIERYKEWSNGAKPKTKGMLDDCDRNGTHWAVFFKEVFRLALRDGHAGILVDMPPRPAVGNNAAGIVTAADTSNARPYFVKYEKDQIVNWDEDESGRLSLLVLEEESTERDGVYGRKEVCRYRVLTPGNWSLWRVVKDATTGVQTLILDVMPDGSDAQGETGLDEIPFSVAYARKEGTLVSTPPLIDLALLNIAHYQLMSDHSTAVYVASNPIALFTGFESGWKLDSTGPYAYIVQNDPNAKGVYVETSGSAFGAARDLINKYEEHIAATGSSMLVKNDVATTATEERGDNLREESELDTAARSMRDCGERVFYFAAKYLDPKAETGGTIHGITTPDKQEMSPQEMQVWIQGQVAGVFSRETVWAKFQQAGKLNEGFNAKTEALNLKIDADAKAERTAQAFNAGFAE
jgi:hypothetical protein